MLDLKAIGSDERRAPLAGVRVARRRFRPTPLSGALAALAGIYLAGQAGRRLAHHRQRLHPGVRGGCRHRRHQHLRRTRVGGAASMIGAIAFLMIPDLIFVREHLELLDGLCSGCPADRRSDAQFPAAPIPTGVALSTPRQTRPRWAAMTRPRAIRPRRPGRGSRGTSGCPRRLRHRRRPLHRRHDPHRAATRASPTSARC